MYGFECIIAFIFTNLWLSPKNSKSGSKYTCCVYMLRPNLQLSLFRSWPAGFEAGCPASKQAGPIRDQLKVTARFETGWADGFETGWDRCKADLDLALNAKTCM